MYQLPCSCYKKTKNAGCCRGSFAVVAVLCVIWTGCCAPPLLLACRSSPYARVKIGGQEYTTRTIPGETNPVFNERFSFLCAVAPTMPVASISFHDRDKCVAAMGAVFWCSVDAPLCGWCWLARVLAG